MTTAPNETAPAWQAKFGPDFISRADRSATKRGRFATCPDLVFENPKAVTPPLAAREKT
jgi:hypothetical protein